MSDATENPAWTPGQWLVMNHTIYALNRDDTNRFSALVQRGWIEQSEKRTEKSELVANAHLMSAAPDLYAALEMVRDADEDCKRDGLPTIPSIARATIDAALAKARGRQ